jgi:hypothetical protein
MHAHMQKGIGFARLDAVIPAQGAIRVPKQALVFGMLGYGVRDESFQGFQGLPFLVLSPDVAEIASDLLTVAFE